MCIRPILRLWIIAVVLLLTLPAPASAQGGATFREEADFLYLENDAARFVFSKTFRGGLYGIVDRASGLDFRADKPALSLRAEGPQPEGKAEGSLPAILFNLTAVRPDGGTEDIGNLSPGRFTYQGEGVSGGARLTLTYTDLADRPLSVVVSVTLPDDSPRAEWRIAVRNDDPSLVLRNIAFPLIFGLSPIGDRGDDDALAFPQWDGLLLHDPESAFNTGDGLFAAYPGDLSLQAAAYYDGEAGLYLAVHDPTGQPKTFAYARLPWEGTTITLFTVNHTPPEVAGYDPSTGSGQRFTPDYPAILGPFHGDWYDAAMIYKAWALQQPWVPPRLAERADVPAWWKAALPVISSASYTDDGRAVLPAERMPAWARDYASYLGQPVTLLTFGWEKHGAWTGPDYFPPRDGEEAFRAATEALHTDGNRKFVYISGTVWRLSRKELPDYDDSERFETIGQPYVAIQADGTPLFDPFYASIGWRAARMCPATPFWQDTVVSSVVGAARLGVDAVSVDEFPIGSLYPCYAPDHGHPPGSGDWQGAAYRAILERARREGQAIKGDLVLTSEEPNEFYLDLLDGYVSRDNRPDWFLYAQYLRRFGERYEPIPLFSAVYHEYTLTFAEPVPLYNAGFDLERLRTSLVRGIASGLVRGKIPSGEVTEMGKADPQLLALFRRVAQATGGYAHHYAILGEMRRPPQIQVPRVTFDWLDVDLTTGRTQWRQTAAPAVLASAWRAPAGHVGYTLANITDQVQRFDLPLVLSLSKGEAEELAAEGLAGPYLVYAVWDGAYQVLYEGESPPAQVSVTLGPWGVALVAVVPAESDEARFVRAQPAPSATLRASATSTPPPTPVPGRGLCGGAALLPLAALGLPVWLARRRRLSRERARVNPPDPWAFGPDAAAAPRAVWQRPRSAAPPPRSQG
ncbi:MAG: DUF6259 domain-containing protein [Anaerolineae bacterium]